MGSFGEKGPLVPQLLEITLIPYVSRLVSTQSKDSSAVRTNSASPAPRPTRFASMATPRYFPASAAPVPAAVHATCVPWPPGGSVLATFSATIGPAPDRTRHT